MNKINNDICLIEGKGGLDLSSLQVLAIGSPSMTMLSGLLWTLLFSTFTQWTFWLLVFSLKKKKKRALHCFCNESVATLFWLKFTDSKVWEQWTVKHSSYQQFCLVPLVRDKVMAIGYLFYYSNSNVFRIIFFVYHTKQNMVMATEIQNLLGVKLVLGLGGWSVYSPTLIYFEFQ